MFTKDWFAHLRNPFGFLLFDRQLPLSHLCKSKVNTKLQPAALGHQDTAGAWGLLQPLCSSLSSRKDLGGQCGVLGHRNKGPRFMCIG